MSSGFITEHEIEEKRRLRQSEWEKVRKPDDPAAAPEEAPPDCRSLYDRLQEQKMKKQEEFEETHKLKNLVKGLDDDEADFLEYVDKAKMDLERQKRLEEVKELSEFRSKMAELREEEVDKQIKQELGLLKTEKKTPKYDDELPSIGTRKTSQSQLLAGIIKRKSPASNTNVNSEDASKKRKLDDDQPKVKSSVIVTGATSETAVDTAYVMPNVPCKGSLICIGVLPGLASYSDSSNSDNDGSSDSDDEDSTPRDLCGRQLVQVEESHADTKKKK